jgi:hypothetical protein
MVYRRSDGILCRLREPVVSGPPGLRLEGEEVTRRRHSGVEISGKGPGNLAGAERGIV